MSLSAFQREGISSNMGTLAGIRASRSEMRNTSGGARESHKWACDAKGLMRWEALLTLP